MFSITLAWTTHELAIYSYNAFHLQTDSFYPITEDQLKIIGLYHTEESVKSIMTGDELQAGYATLEKAIFELPNSSISFQDWTSQITAAMNI